MVSFRAFSVATTVVLLVQAFSVALGQTGNSDNDPPLTNPAEGLAGAQQQLDDVLARLTQVEQELRTVRALADRVTNNESRIESIATSVATNGDALRSLFDRIDDNDEAIRQLQARVSDNDAKLRDVAKQDSQGGWYPNLLGNVQKPEFQQEVREIVTRTGATQGRLWIRNPYPYEHIIYINGARWRALSGLSYVWAPFGNISVSHIGGRTPPVKTARDWEFNRQDRFYELTYDINSPW